MDFSSLYPNIEITYNLCPSVYIDPDQEEYQDILEKY
jgi:DNA polymerase elongation subunit (family B)